MGKQLIAILLVLLPLCSKAREITLWNYYQSPPFVNPDNTGLVNDTVDFLNQALKGQFKLKLKSVPRGRVDRALNSGKQGAVLFVNWLWMGKDAKSKYLWTLPIINDQNVFISSQKKPVRYQNRESLIGLNFGAIVGRMYPPLEALFKTRQLKRLNSNSEIEVLKLVLKGRVDVTTQPLTQVTALSEQLGISQKLYIAKRPLFRFQRHLLITPQLPKLHKALNEVLLSLADNQHWLAILARHNLSALVVE